MCHNLTQNPLNTHTNINSTCSVYTINIEDIGDAYTPKRLNQRNLYLKVCNNLSTNIMKMTYIVASDIKVVVTRLLSMYM